VRTGVRGRDEIGELGRTLDLFAEGLSSTLHELRADRELMAAVLSSMREGVLVLDREARIVIANPSLRASFGLDANVRGRTIPEAFGDEPCVVAWLDRARRHESELPEEIRCGPGSSSYLVHATDLPGEGHTLAVFVDVTALRRLEGVRTEFVANASHELRTPITIIKSASEACQAELRRDVEATERFIQIIDRNAERLRKLVDDLLELTRVESAEFKLNLEPLSIEPLVQSVLQLFQDHAEKKHIQLDSSLPRDALVVRADRHATEEVLGNLIDNALKYCSDGSRVSVRAEPHGAALRIAVEDTGPGIEEAHLSRVFERFYRVDPGRSSEIGGTGLGLAIVKHLVEAMEGTVGVESVPGRGSRFWFTLPRLEVSC
jgi:two-component system phosphate regulon sensor histidine kinase PhoR